jgi:hypothetical protein
VPAGLVDGAKDPPIPRRKELIPQFGLDEHVLLRPPVVGELETVDTTREALRDIPDDAQIELHDPVGQHLDPLTLQVQVYKDVLEAVKGVHALEEQHKDRGGHVLTFGAFKAFFHALIKHRGVGVGPAEMVQGTPIGQM